MKILFAFVFLLFYTQISSNYIKIKYKAQDKTVLYNTMWNEGRGVRNHTEFHVMIDCIKNRIKHEDFPSTLDSVIKQPYQFQHKNSKPLPKEFIDKVDSLWSLPIKYDYLYFRSKNYKWSKWMKFKNFKRINNSKHEFTN